MKKGEITMDKLAKTREDLWLSISGLTNEQANEVIEEGTWSIAQVIEHLHLMESNVVRGITDALLSDEKLKAEQKSLEFVKDRTHKVKAPDNLVPSNDFKVLDRLKEELTNTRKALLECIKDIKEDDFNEISFIHRRFGVLSIKQWVSLVGFHEQRHINQIEEIKQNLNLSKERL